MSDDKPDSELTSLTNRAITTKTLVSSTDHEAWRNDIEGRVDDQIANAKDNSNHRAGTSAPTDNTVEGQIWADTTTDPAVLKFDPDGSGADTPIVVADTNLRFKTIEIGDWDMDATTNVTVAHGLTIANVRTAQLMIRSDSATVGVPSGGGNTNEAAPETDVWIEALSTTDVALSRRTGGVFDNVNYDSTSFNRGWITIGYVVA